MFTKREINSSNNSHRDLWYSPKEEIYRFSLAPNEFNDVELKYFELKIYIIFLTINLLIYSFNKKDSNRCIFYVPAIISDLFVDCLKVNQI